jgi:hypothetical protein
MKYIKLKDHDMVFTCNSSHSLEGLQQSINVPHTMSKFKLGYPEQETGAIITKMQLLV